MTFWQWLDRVGERRQQRALVRMSDKRLLANVLGMGLVSGFLGALAALYIFPIPRQNEQIITYMIGQLSGMAGMIIAYHYSQKAGDTELDRKRTENTAALAEVARKALDAGPPSTGDAAANAAHSVAAAADDRAAEIEDSVR